LERTESHGLADGAREILADDFGLLEMVLVAGMQVLGAVVLAIDSAKVVADIEVEASGSDDMAAAEVCIHYFETPGLIDLAIRPAIPLLVSVSRDCHGRQHRYTPHRLLQVVHRM
jgi:hypothetical protein